MQRFGCIVGDMASIQTAKAPSGSHARPWLVFIDGRMVTTKRGNGRRFATEQAALAAGQAAAAAESTAGLANATAALSRERPLPRCEHGQALRDHGGDTLEPPCGCRA
jgi:hypothetical protein